ncbi:Transposon Tn7 transposition protein TnsC [Caballeronia catudaia]|uniref:Transposon Tn7 transposition protein TnsC n=1 Tax=Caballeronia catudaia TaxID=1777136 RepID=A0A158BW91_9BURK|nr:ATP-binding protein [Caballeronia catudaia]SAK74374.1 Transposon Tn7 transposition protein TnsC [Caballeronia catudaia]
MDFHPTIDVDVRGEDPTSLSDLSFVDAIYVPRDEDLGIENPLIRALPIYINSEAVLEAFSNSPSFNLTDRRLPASARIQRIASLGSYFESLTCHPTLIDSIFRLIIEGYMWRNPWDHSQKLVRSRYAASMSKKTMTPVLPFHPAHSAVMALTGVSGVGKSTSIYRTLSFVPPVIRHDKLTGSNLQVVWLKVDCPPDGSIKQLFRWILIEYDRLLGTHYEQEVGKTARLDQLMNKAAAVARYHHTGLLVVDEIQFAARGAARRGDPFMDFFVTFTNIAQIPILIAGTPQARPLMEKSFRLARRVCDRGSMTFTNMGFDDEWDFFLRGLFKFQWTSTAQRFNSDLSEVFYDLTQGIHALVLRLFQFAQIVAIQDRSEKISKEVLRYVSREWLGPVQPMLDALKSKKKNRIQIYNDLLIDTLAGLEEAVNKEAEDAKIVEAREQRQRNQAKLASVSDLVAMGVREAQALVAVLEVLKRDASLTGADLTREACEKAGVTFNADLSLGPDEPPSLQDIVGDTTDPDKAVERLRLAGYVIGSSKKTSEPEPA